MPDLTASVLGGSDHEAGGGNDRQPRALTFGEATFQVFEGHRPTVHVALKGMASKTAEKQRLHLGLHALGYRRNAKIAGNVQDGLDDDAIILVGLQVVDERAIDLERVDRQALQMRQRGIARAKIIESDLDAECFQRGERHVDFGDIVEHDVFGKLDREAAGVGAGRAHGIGDKLDQFISELLPASVDCHLQVAHLRLLLPAAERTASGRQYERINLPAKAGALGKWNEYRRRYLTACRVIPTKQCFDAKTCSRIIYLRLIVESKTATLKRVAEFGGESQLLFEDGLHLGGEERYASPTRGLGLVHRHVSAFEQLVDAHVVATKERDADACRGIERKGVEDEKARR